MTAPATAESRATQARKLRPLYWALFAIAIVDLGLFLSHSVRFSRPHPYGWVLPAGLLCMAVGGLIGVRHPLAHRVLIGVALVLAVASLVLAFRA